MSLTGDANASRTGTSSCESRIQVWLRHHDLSLCFLQAWRFVACAQNTSSVRMVIRALKKLDVPIQSISWLAVPW